MSVRTCSKVRSRNFVTKFSQQQSTRGFVWWLPLALLGAFIGHKDAQAQQREDEERRAAQAAVRQFQKQEVEQFERRVFQQDGNAFRARQRLDSLLAMQIETIDRACKLTDAQKKKLQLAGRGDIKRFFDRYERVKQKSQVIEQDEQKFQEIQQDFNQLRVTLRGGLFHEDSLLVKSMHNTLTSEQFTRYDAMARERRASRHRASIDQAVGILQRGIPLSDAQRRELITLMANETKPSRRPGPYDYDSYVLLWQLGRLPEEKLKPLFDDKQWQMVKLQLDQVKELEPMLKQSGQLPNEDD
jgi:hypothetical protein